LTRPGQKQEPSFYYFTIYQKPRQKFE